MPPTERAASHDVRRYRILSRGLECQCRLLACSLVGEAVVVEIRSLDLNNVLHGSDGTMQY